MPGCGEHNQPLYDDGHSDSPKSVCVNGPRQQRVTLGIEGCMKRAGGVLRFGDEKTRTEVAYARLRSEDADEGYEGQKISMR
jgi:hypothetical protein